MPPRDEYIEHRMPSGERCYFREEDHSYWESVEPCRKRDPDGEWKGKGRLTGVSTVVAPFDWQKDALIAWAVRVNLEAVAELANGELDYMLERAGPGSGDVLDLEWLRDPVQIKRRIERAGTGDQDVKEEAGERGTNVHLHTLNALSRGAPTPAYSEMNEIEIGYSRGVTQFWLDHTPQTMQAEQVICDIGLGIAGRLDWRGLLQEKCGDPCCACASIDLRDIGLIDLKTGGFTGTKDHVQVAGYDHGSRVCGFGPSSWLAILKVSAAGTYQLIRAYGQREDFLAAIEIYRRKAMIDKMARADRKAREEATA